MVIDKKILDELTAKAKKNPRLRCNDMVPGGVVLNIEKGHWHSLKCLKSGTVLLEAKDGIQVKGFLFIRNPKLI